MDDSVSMDQIKNRLLKQQVHHLLLQRDCPGLIDLCKKDKHLWRVLWTSLYEADENLRWPAIEAVAKVMERWWQTGQKERVREYIRRLLWSMCDEAGEMGWSAPQTIAEAIVSIPELLEPYGSMMVSRTFEEPTLAESGLWGIGRLGTMIREVVKPSWDMILRVFGTEDTEILGVAAWAMGEVGFEEALPYLEGLKNREEKVWIYINSAFYQKTIGQWAQEAIVKLEANPSNKRIYNEKL